MSARASPASPARFDYTQPPPTIEANRARRAAAMVRVLDEAWRQAGRHPLTSDAALLASELAGWTPASWAALALASGGRPGYAPSPQTREAVIGCYSWRAVEHAAQHA